MFKTVLLLAFVANIACGDLYMHNPRGSNDRLNEANTNRNNGDRLFDSQNNAKGGYCLGPAMNFYERSMISVEWTNQHGCGQNPKLYCNMVAQYMCGYSDETDPMNKIRDGTSTDTVTTIRTDPNNNNQDIATMTGGEYTYGVHEPAQFYYDCMTRDRNYGLWSADRQINNPGRPATNTRQNNNGARRGLECPEERDYYPYWHPTSWRDIAILTQDTKWCPFYKAESENVKMRGHCKAPSGEGAVANNPGECKEPNEWVEEWTFGHSAAEKKLPQPDCVLAPWARDNHLGSGMTGFENSYNWTLPSRDEEPCIEANNCDCVFRLRYNISTHDLDWGTGKSDDPKSKVAGDILSGNHPEVQLDWTKNEDNSPVKEDPTVTFDDVTLKLAIDTTQFGRTFQDRTHVFHIIKRPDGMALTTRIYNLNVRGKRGNIVQAYPATEYDFVPTNLEVRQGDFIHFQWTGCDTNPAGNAGEGTAQTDRSNIVQLGHFDSAPGRLTQAFGKTTPVDDDWMAANPDKVMFKDKALRQYMAYGDQDPATCATQAQLEATNPGNEDAQDADPENCFKLNKMSQHFDAGAIQMNSTGDYYYMSSRNNNFSNRDQKASLIVSYGLPIWAIVVVVIGGVVGLGGVATAGSMFYARGHPHSGIANMLNRVS